MFRSIVVSRLTWVDEIDQVNKLAPRGPAALVLEAQLRVAFHEQRRTHTLLNSAFSLYTLYLGLVLYH
jgi:hypothetical protein